MSNGMMNFYRAATPTDDAAYFAQRAATEREQAIGAVNEVVASVHETLACRYAALAAARAKSHDAPEQRGPDWREA